MAEVQDEDRLLTIFRSTGEFGPFQWKLFGLAMVASLITSQLFVDTYLLTYNMPHRCNVSLCDNTSSVYNESHLVFTTPWSKEHQQWDDCTVYTRSNFTTHGASNIAIHGPATSVSAVPDDQCVALNFNNEDDPERCTNGWIYDTSVFRSTAVSTFDLVCGRAWLRPLVSSLNMAGMLVGAITVGNVGDRFGRKVGLLAGIFLVGGGGTLSALAITDTMLLGARLLAGAGAVGVFMVTFVHAAECVGPKWRTFCGIMIEIPFAIGCAITGVLAYFIRDWRHLQLATALPGFLLVSYIWLVPESPRWLILNGKRQEAVNVILQAARANGVSLDEEQLRALADKDPTSNQDALLVKSKMLEGERRLPKTKTVLDLLKTPKMRKRSLNMFFCWFVCTLVYYGFSSNASNLDGDVFVNFIATMLIDIPSYLFTYFALNRLGRKGTLCLMMICGGVASLASGFVPTGVTWLVVTLSLVGKFGIASAFATVYIYSTEIFPTEYRGVGLGACNLGARSGGILAPFIASLSEYYKPLPLILFGIFSLTSGCLVVLLPETMGSELPQTLEDSERFGSNQPACYFACIRDKHTQAEEKLKSGVC